ESNAKAPWYFGIGFLLFWILLFFAVVIPLFYRLPNALSIDDAKSSEFVGERAYNTLDNLVNIGPKVPGSKANEVDAVEFLLNEISDIKNYLLEDYFTLDIDVQKTSGGYVYSSLLEVYEGVQNIVVKLSSKNSTSESYLLINSHFDSVPTSPAAGDDGFMVATMLEVLRVIATTRQHFEHPLVFLFNGDEEMGMQASHGFITQHKWAKNCKAFINLDAAGSGGREILFQTGPSHPWITGYYKKGVKYPFATTIAEEIFQEGLIPSDTDYRIFVQFGNIPGTYKLQALKIFKITKIFCFIGLDLGQMFNGYVYHTKYDRTDVIPRGAIQNTGDNVLGLVRALSNATELHNIEAYEGGNVVFFDFLGLFFVSYLQETGTIINYSVSGSVFVLILISIWRMSVVSSTSFCSMVLRLILSVIIQTIALVLGLTLPLLVAYYLDSFGLSLTYFSSTWLIIGLYVCPSLIGLSLPIMIYLQSQPQELPFIYKLQLGLHGWALVLAFLTIGIASIGVRSVYVFMLPLTFYTFALVLNLLTTFHDRGYSWAGTITTFQVVPFLYICYVFYTFIVTLTPMNGRSGSASNPDTMIAGLTALGTMLSFGFLVPLIHMFRRPSIVVVSLVLTTAITIYLASDTQIGFPYRTKTNTGRVMYQHVRKTFYEYDGSVVSDESGYLFNFQDRREDQLFSGVNLTGSVRTKDDCVKHMMCGVPLYDERWVNNRLQGMWLPRNEPITPPCTTNLTLVNKIVLANSTTARFEFKLTGPSYLNLFIQVNDDDFVTISNWTFSQTYLKEPPASPLSYHIFITFGIDDPTLDFFLDVTVCPVLYLSQHNIEFLLYAISFLKKPNGNFNVPLFELGVSGHCIGENGDELSKEFATQFPGHVILVEWPSSYKRYIF
ncbi:hypothetical protein KR222_008448, partial [Zaprionus bogoriensis]